MARRATDPFMRLVKKALEQVLEDPKASVAEKVRAAEVAAKLLLVQHKVTDGDDGRFFGA